MKRFLTLLLCACLLVSLVACSKNTDTTPNDDTGGAPEPTNDNTTDSPTEPTEEPESQPEYRLLYEHTLGPNGTIFLAVQYHYNADGKLDRVSKTNEHTAQDYTVECDSNGNPVKYVSDNDTVRFEYNEQGLLTKQTDGNTTTAYSYDESGNLLRTVYVMLGGGGFTMNHIWQDGVMVKTEVSANGDDRYILYTYDEEGREIKAETYNDRDELLFYSETQYEDEDYLLTKTTENFDADGTLQATRIWDYEKVS